MSTTYTQARIFVSERCTMDGPSYGLVGEDGLPIIYGLLKPTARRLAACWNAFLPVPTEEIESMGGMVMFKGEPAGELAELRAENKIMLSLLQDARSTLTGSIKDLESYDCDNSAEVFLNNKISNLLNGKA